MKKRMLVGGVVAILLLLGATGAPARNGQPTAKQSKIGLTRQEAIQFAEQVLQGLWPSAYKHHMHDLHCKEHGRLIVCPPVYFKKRISAEEVEMLYSLIKSDHPYKEISGTIWIHSDPSTQRGFYYGVKRCNYVPPYNCWEVT